MINNATLTRIDLPAGADASGDRTWTDGVAIAVRCSVGAPTRTRTVALGQVVKDATAVMYVWNPPTKPVDQCLVRYAIDERSEVVMEVIKAIDWVHSSLGGFELFLKEQ